FQGTFKYALHFRVGAFDQALIDRPRGTVDGDIVTFLQRDATGSQGAFFVVDGHVTRAAYADLAQLTGDQGRVGGDTTTGGQNPLGVEHALEVFRGRLGTAQHHLVALA